MKQLFLLTAISASILTSPISNAGMVNLTSHSRANCVGFNESIDWDYGVPHLLNTVSNHFNNNGRTVHEVRVGWAKTWRSAAYHFRTDDPTGYTVKGTHWESVNNRVYNIANEVVINCSIYDGWWDRYHINNKAMEQTQYMQANYNKLQVIPKGISIVPLKESALPEEIKRNALIEIQNKKFLSYKGYKETESFIAKKIIYLGKKDIVDNNDINDTNLKSSLSYIKLAFPYKQISKNPIGFAVGGSLDNNGWTKVSEIFEENFGKCKYDVDAYTVYRGAAQLIKEDTRYDISNKPTTVEAEGSYNTGFLYRVTWFDSQYIHTLQCVNKTFNKSITERTIKKAQEIDKLN